MTRGSPTLWRAGAAAAAAVATAVLLLGDRPLAETWLLTFIILAGLAAGSLGLLAIGHLLGGAWLAPLKSELEGAALTAPLLALIALPIAAGLERVYPWAQNFDPLSIPEPRAAYLAPSFFLLRGAAYLSIWSALAWWLTRTAAPRRASAVALVLLAPTVTLAGIDWVMTRDPSWWSSLFGFAFAFSQLLAAMSGAILISILRLEDPHPERLKSLEQGLLSLSLLALWVWFVQFLIAWMGNLPDAAGWYLSRRGGWLWVVPGVSLTALIAAIALLVPPGQHRVAMAAGSALLLIHHVTLTAWLVRPALDGAWWAQALVMLGLAAAWGLWFAAAVQARGPDVSTEPVSG